MGRRSPRHKKHHIQRKARRLPQSLENALGVLVQAILFALSLAAFKASEPSVMSIDSVQSLKHKKRVPSGVRKTPRRWAFAGAGLLVGMAHLPKSRASLYAHLIGLTSWETSANVRQLALDRRGWAENAATGQVVLPPSQKLVGRRVGRILRGVENCEVVAMLKAAS